MRIARRSVVSSAFLLVALSLAAGPISAANAGSVDSAGTPAESDAVTVKMQSPTPTTGTDATDAAVAAGLVLAVGGLTVFTARSIRHRPRRLSRRAR